MQKGSLFASVFLLVVAGVVGSECDSDSCDPDVTSLLQTSGEVLEKVKPVELGATDILSDVLSKPLSFRAVAAEFLAMTLFVIIGCGSAMALVPTPGWQLQVSLTFGLAITTLAYTIGHISGGQINCAVTLGLCIHGSVTWVQGFMNFLGQMFGSVLGALILHAIFRDQDKTGGLGSNSLQETKDDDGAIIYSFKEHKFKAFVAELAGTFLLVFVVLETAATPATKANIVNAPLAIGFAVFLSHCLLIPITGCSINPTRSFGPMLVSTVLGKGVTNKDGDTIPAVPLGEQWIFWVAPLLGAALAPGIVQALHG
jgi:MIP family channel proteins